MKPAVSLDSESENKSNEEKLLRNREHEDLKSDTKEKYYPQSLPPNKMLSLSLQECRRLSAFSLYSTVSLGTSVMDMETLNTTLKDQEKVPKSQNICDFLKRIVLSTYESILTLKYMRVQIICLGAGCLSLGYVNFQMWIPFVIRNAGYSLEMSAWCVSSSSIANTIGRIVMSFLSDRKWFNIKIGYMFSMFLLGSSIIAFSIVKDLTLFLVCVCCWGLGIGIAYSLNATVFIAVMGIEAFPAVFGVSSLFVAIFSVAFGPIVGIIRDATFSYTYALCFLGVAEWIGFGAWLLMPFAIQYDEKTMLKEKLKEIEEVT
ncbi:hypothetical protein Avbf_08059 [Armadillidium vulgare]|nr:hypothetical protein Avbf_08059 [Armadillidium vulgare]